MSNATIAEAVPAAEPRRRLRWVALTLCAATMFVEGYDAQLMGYVVPGIARDWGVAPGSLTLAIAAGLVGMMFGGFLIAPLADSYGRRRVVLYSVIAFAILTIATAFVETLPALIVLRLLTGFGLGGAMPNAIAITAEFSPNAKRASAVAAMFSFYSIGAGFGGIIAAWLIPAYGWGSVLIFCGGLALVLWPVLVVAMPESYVPQGESKPKIPVGRLFSEGRARITILLWIIFFANLMELFFLTSWLPTTIGAQGVAEYYAVIATAVVQFAGVAAAFAMGPLVDRYGPQRVLPVAFIIAALCIAGIGLAGSAVAFTMVMAFGIGIGTVGAQNCNNGVAAKFYPTSIRATGVGWALAVGRIGSIVGPVVGGILLSTHVDIRTIFLFAAIPPLVATLAYLAMGRSLELHREALQD
ncbi:MAG TPA: aromatic acid/H+ symport family MFS transporter [Micropepsaceae bacterium]|nr:aromatic acid/H+ symport family MFS transporter [Micropepsaceae bacterium]